MERQSINVKIADRYYPFKVNIDDEATMRRAAVLINERIDSYRKKFNNLDIQDTLSTALINFVRELIEERNSDREKHIIKEIESIDNLLEDYIKPHLN